MRPSKKAREFSQRLAWTVVIFSMAIVFYIITINAILLLLSLQGMPEETIATITTFGGVVSTAAMAVYGFLCGWRDNSKNKYGVTLSELGITDPPSYSDGDRDDNNENEAEV